VGRGRRRRRRGVGDTNGKKLGRGDRQVSAKRKKKLDNKDRVSKGEGIVAQELTTKRGGTGEETHKTEVLTQKGEGGRRNNRELRAGVGDRTVEFTSLVRQKHLESERIVENKEKEASSKGGSCVHGKNRHTKKEDDKRGGRTLLH